MDTRSEKGLRDPGRRKNNEDFIAYFEPTDPTELRKYGCLYIIADGVGGAAQGERASQYAAEKILFDYYHHFEPDPDSPDPDLVEPLVHLRSILRRVNEEIYDYATQNKMRMATTIVVAVIREGFLYVANVGDSRAYLIRDGVAEPINRDHSLVGEMVENGEMTEAEAMASSIKNRLTRSLGGDPDVIVDGYPQLQLQTGDKILLCSDGLTRYALKKDIASMTMEGTPQEIEQRLIKFANDSGGADNVSVIVVAYKPEWALELPPFSTRRRNEADFETAPTIYSRRRSGPYLREVKISRKWLFISMLVELVFILVSYFALVTFLPENPPTPTETIKTEIQNEGFVFLTSTMTPPDMTPTATLTETPLPAITQTSTDSPTVMNEGSSLILAKNICGNDIHIRVIPGPKGGERIIYSIAPGESFELTQEIQTFPSVNGRARQIWLAVLVPSSPIPGNKGWFFYDASCIELPEDYRLDLSVPSFKTTTPKNP